MMPVITNSPQSDWSDNIFVLSITRVLVVIAVTYLARSLYQLARYHLAPTHSILTAARVDQDLDLALNNLGRSRSSFSLTIDGDLGGMSNVDPPPPTYDPRIRSQRSRVASPERCYGSDTLTHTPDFISLQLRMTEADSYAAQQNSISSPSQNGEGGSAERTIQLQQEGDGDRDYRYL